MRKIFALRALHRRVVDPLAVGREGRREVEGVVLGHVREGLRVQVVGVDVRSAVLDARGTRRCAPSGEKAGLSCWSRPGIGIELADLAAERVQEQELPAALAPDEDRDRVAVGRDREVDAADGPGRQPLRDDVLVLGLEALGQVLEELAVAGREDDDVGVLVERRDRGAEVARREGARRRAPPSCPLRSAGRGRRSRSARPSRSGS